MKGTPRGAATQSPPVARRTAGTWRGARDRLTRVSVRSRVCAPKGPQLRLSRSPSVGALEHRGPPAALALSISLSPVLISSVSLRSYMPFCVSPPLSSPLPASCSRRAERWARAWAERNCSLWLHRRHNRRLVGRRNSRHLRLHWLSSAVLRCHGRGAAAAGAANCRAARRRSCDVVPPPGGRHKVGSRLDGDSVGSSLVQAHDVVVGTGHWE